MQSLNDLFINRHNDHENKDASAMSSASMATPSSLTHPPSHLSEVNHVKQLSKDIGDLFNNTDYCDLTLIVDSVEFNVHKIVLAARSEYFRALLFSGMKESSCSSIEIREVKAACFRLLLQYIYTGKICLRNEREESLIDLLGVCHQYGFVELERAVSNFLESILDIRNVCSIYDIASLYKLASLQETCAKFIDKHSAQIIKQQSLLQLSCESLACILSRDSFSAPEIDIFHVIRQWHELHAHNISSSSSSSSKDDDASQSQSSSVSSAIEVSTAAEASSTVATPDGGSKSTKRHMQLIEQIRLPLMKLDELLNDVRSSNLIDSDVILDAIKLKHESNDMSLKYRGVLYPNENVACSRYQAIVIKGELKSALLDGDTVNYDLDRGFSYHPIDDTNQNAIVVKLGNPTIFNQIKLFLWDKDTRSYSYFVEVSMNEVDWVRVVDYSEYLCRSWQNLYFKPIVARFVKVTGVRNTVNRIFHLVSMEVRYTLDHYELYNQLIVPRRNIATIADSGVVWEGVSRTRNTLINGDYKNYDWDSGYTCHQLGSGYICIQLAQPYFVSSMRILLWDCDNRSYSYYVETSIDQTNWTIVADKRNEACKSWQVLVFEPRPVSFIRITGTHNTANEVFHCVHFECPCEADVLARFIEQQQHQQQLQLQHSQQAAKLHTLTTTSTSTSSSTPLHHHLQNAAQLSPSNFAIGVDQQRASNMLAPTVPATSILSPPSPSQLAQVTNSMSMTTTAPSTETPRASEATTATATSSVRSMSPTRPSFADEARTSLGSDLIGDFNQISISDHSHHHHHHHILQHQQTSTTNDDVPSSHSEANEGDTASSEI